jgi:uncharacterized protein (DUF3084 family)
MIWTSFALLLMVVLGGFISYYGDLQGRRWGKKRVSWFGMRPKHTAILITSLTGAFISLLSIATILIVSPVLRDVILRGEQAIRENRDVREQIAQKRSELKGAQADTKLAQEAQAKAEQEKIVKQTQLAQAETRLQELSKELKPKQEAVAQLELQRARLERDVQRLQVQLNHMGQQNYALGKQNLALSRNNGLLAQQNQGLGKANGELSKTNEALQATQTALKKSNSVLDESNKVLIESNRVNIQENEKKINAQAAELNTKQQELALVTGQLEKAKEDLNFANVELESSRRFFTLTYDQVRRGRVSVRAGGELARTVIDAHMSFSVVKQQLEKLLIEADKTAQAVGAARGQNGRAVTIVPKRVVTQAGEFYFNSEEESINAFAELLTGTDKPNVIIISAFTNTIEGEQVPVNLQRSLVVPMFARDAVLASARLNANLSDDQLKQVIAQFLQTNVRDALVKAGAISQVDPVSGINELGQFDPIELGQLALKARQMHSDLVLKAVAKSAISSADPLDQNHLILEVVRASGNAKDS